MLSLNRSIHLSSKQSNRLCRSQRRGAAALRLPAAAAAAVRCGVSRRGGVMETETKTTMTTQEEVEALMDPKNTVGGGVEDAYGEDRATEEQLVTPWAVSVASRNAKRPILEEPLKEKKKLRLYKTSDEVKEERKEEETQTHKESEVQEEKTQEENQRVYEYTSGEDDDYVWPNGKRRRTRDEWALYYKQVEESEGFDVDPSPDTIEFGLTALTNFENEDLIRCTKSSIEQFNKENATNYEFVKIEKTTCIVAAGFWYNITFQATDGGGSPKTFQAKVFYGISGNIEVSFCRLKPTTS